MKIPLYLRLIVLTLLGCQSKPVHSPKFIPSFEASKKTTHPIKEDQVYTFGYLEVLENRKKGNRKTIKFPVYIFKSRSKTPKKDPIIYTVGGPGYTTMSSAQYMKYYQYLDDRDFILVEQRGNAYAKPHLDCPEWSKAIHESSQPNFDDSNYETLFEKAAQACKDRLQQKGIDLNGYNTNEIAADINDLVKVLGIQQYNLLTISYSTKIAQVLIRDYPDRIRSVVMDSPLPLEASFDEESVGNLLETLSKLLLDCEQDEKCGQAYPNIKARFFKYLEEKTTTPLKVDIQHPKTGKTETFYLKGQDLVLVFSAASTRDVSNVPLEINRLLNNDLTSVKKRLKTLFEGPSSGAGVGMRLSVWCAEEQPFNSSEKIAQATNQYPQVKGLSPAVYDEEICKI